MVLFINACVRSASRTKRLADCYLAKLNQPYKEICLHEIEFPIVDTGFLNRRDRLIMEQDFSSEVQVFDVSLQKEFSEKQSNR